MKTSDFAEARGCDLSSVQKLPGKRMYSVWPATWMFNVNLFASWHMYIVLKYLQPMQHHASLQPGKGSMGYEGKVERD